MSETPLERIKSLETEEELSPYAKAYTVVEHVHEELDLSLKDVEELATYRAKECTGNPELMMWLADRQAAGKTMAITLAEMQIRKLIGQVNVPLYYSSTEPIDPNYAIALLGVFAEVKEKVDDRRDPAEIAPIKLSGTNVLYQLGGIHLAANAADKPIKVEIKDQQIDIFPHLNIADITKIFIDE
jgi:hypothetical protein